jgi:hypothetical protein
MENVVPMKIGVLIGLRNVCGVLLFLRKKAVLKNTAFLFYFKFLSLRK